GAPSTFTADFLNFASVAAGITLPRPAEFDVGIEQFIYTTQDRGQLLEATSLLAYPEGLDTKEPAPVILMLHGTVGFADLCSPSLVDEVRLLAAIFATYGYIVVAPDFLGLKGLGEPTGFKHPYLVGEATAIASLDALRALRKLPEDRRGGLCPATDFAYFGASQGGHAALWVDRLAPYYARELTALGGVAAVPPADVLGQMQRALQTEVSATGNTIAYFGSTADWYGHEAGLSDVFVSPLDVEVPAALEVSCDPEDELGLGSDAILADLFVQPLLDAANADTLVDYDWMGCIAQEATLADTSIPRIESALQSYGILNVFGEDDGLVNTPIERVAYEELCESGMPYDYLECAGAGHSEAVLWSLPEAVAFIEDRVNGVPFDAPDTCAPAAVSTCSGSD
ncbi:MAG: hypothetical protein KUG77_01215, partial [Nannocystaceae bacterium]|nr:hypothetical protein [Nannocystaceae bacterium]